MGWLIKICALLSQIQLQIPGVEVFLVRRIVLTLLAAFAVSALQAEDLRSVRTHSHTMECRRAR